MLPLALRLIQALRPDRHKPKTTVTLIKTLLVWGDGCPSPAYEPTTESRAHLQTSSTVARPQPQRCTAPAARRAPTSNRNHLFLIILYLRTYLTHDCDGQLPDDWATIDSALVLNI